MATSLGEFFIGLFVDSAKGELSIGNLVAAMGELEVATVGEIAILAELQNKLSEITEASIKTALGLRDYTTKTGASTEALQKWQFVAKQAGIDGESVAGAFLEVGQALEKLIHAPQIAPGWIKNLNSYLTSAGANLDLRSMNPQHPEEFFKRLRDNTWFQSRNQAEQQMIMGLTPFAGMLGILSQRNMKQKEFNQFLGEASTMPSKDVNTFVEMHRQLGRVMEASKKIGEIIASWFGPSFLQALNRIADLLVATGFLIDNRRGQTFLGAGVEVGKEVTSGEYNLGTLLDLAIRGVAAKNDIMDRYFPAPPIQVPYLPGEGPKVIYKYNQPHVTVNGSGLSKEETHTFIDEHLKREMMTFTSQTGHENP